MAIKTTKPAAKPAKALTPGVGKLSEVLEQIQAMANSDEPVGKDQLTNLWMELFGAKNNIESEIKAERLQIQQGFDAMFSGIERGTLTQVVDAAKNASR